MERLLNIEEAAMALKTTVGTLRYWRHRGTGPSSAKVAGRVVYREADLNAWLEEQFDRGRNERNERAARHAVAS